MKKADLKILIVEDDSTLGPALKEAVTRAGYCAHLAVNAAEVLKTFKIHDYRAVIMDCMLPGKSGLDLVEELRKEVNNDFLLFLMSGVFKDKQYIREAIDRTTALDFFTKPFDITQFINTLDESLSEVFETERDPIFELLATRNHSPQDRIVAVKAMNTVRGYDLPYIYSLLASTQFSGQLKLTYPDGDISTVGFQKGRIDHVQHPKCESYFGVLLVENGFTSHEEVQSILAASDNSKPIGERLVAVSYTHLTLPTILLV